MPMDVTEALISGKTIPFIIIWIPKTSESKTVVFVLFTS